MRITDFDWQYLEFLNLHGFATSEMLYQWTKPQRPNPFGPRQSLAKLRGYHYVFQPDFQLDPYSRRNKYFIYCLAERGIGALQFEDRYAEAIFPSGNDIRHQFGIAQMTGSLHIGIRDAGHTYVPGHRLVQTTLKCPTTGYTPDQLCAVDYGDGARILLVEFERSYLKTTGHYPTAAAQNKSTDYYVKKLDRLDVYIGQGVGKKHLGQDTAILALFAFVSPVAEAKFRNIVDTKYKKIANRILTTVVDGFIPYFDPKPPYDLYTRPWNISKGQTRFINTP